MSDGLDIVSLGEPLVEFNQIHADDPHTYLQGFGGDTSNMAPLPRDADVRALLEGAKA